MASFTAHRTADEMTTPPTTEDAQAHASIVMLFDGLDGNGPIDGCALCELASAERLWPGWVQRQVDDWAAEAAAASTTT
jgi:hypothetical protein